MGSASVGIHQRNTLGDPVKLCLAARFYLRMGFEELDKEEEGLLPISPLEEESKWAEGLWGGHVTRTRKVSPLCHMCIHGCLY